MTADGPPSPALVALVSRTTVDRNLKALRDSLSGSALLVDLSADAFGHGLEQSALAAVDGGVEILGLSRLSDAIALREFGVGAEIVVWVPPARGELQALATLGLGVGVASAEGLKRALSAHASSLWLRVGSLPGVSTLSAAELNQAVQVLASAAVDAEFSVNLAFVGGDARELDAALSIAAASDLLISGCVVPFGFDEPMRGTPVRAGGPKRLTRVGAELFGLSETTAAAPEPTRPALSLRAPILALKHAEAGVGVSYGYTYRTRDETRLALVPLGYGDGIDRSAGNRGEVLLGGSRYTIAGRVAMDASVLDVGDADVAVGDTVEFFGDPANGAPTAEEWGGWLGVSSAAVVSSLTARVPRRWM